MIDDATLNICKKNIDRARNIANSYQKGKKGRKKASETDVLRAAVVFIHAAIEDFLRSLIKQNAHKNPHADLSKYSILGKNDRKGRKKEFDLNDLQKFSEMNVRDLISRSVDEYVDRWESFNDVGEILNTLQQCGVPKNIASKESIEIIGRMIARRHRIVHHADLNENRGARGQQQTKSIRAADVDNFADSAERLFEAIAAYAPRAAAPNAP